jgi:hypothetical protein
MLQKLLVSTFAVVAAASCVEPGSSSTSLSEYASELSLIPRGSSCADLGLGGQQLTLPGPVAAGSYALDANNSLSITYYDESNTIFYFNQATIKIYGVLISIGDKTLVWDIPGGGDAWGSLHGPPDPDTDEINEAEEISFCFDYELRIQPSPYAHHAQLPTWTITKTGRTDRLVLAEGQSELLEYDITVSPGAITGAGQFIEGPVFVINGSPHTVTVSQVNTMVGTIAADITCPTAPPFTMAPFSLVECSFHADVPDTADRNVVGSGAVTHGLKIATQEVVASFAAHNVATTTLDNCVAVFDEAVPYTDHFLGSVCVEDGETTFSFSYEAGPFECGTFAVTNEASFEGLDTGNIATASWTVNGEVECSPGCTLSVHYWRNHSHFGPRRYNPTWDLIGTAGENTTFFLSGGTYVQAVWHRSLGNAYWTLARPYIGARLNQLNGAQFTPATTTAFNAATALLATYTPGQVLGNRALRKQFVKAAATLRDFNSGRTGPGKCTCRPDLDDED